MKCVSIKGVKEFEIKEIDKPVSNGEDVIIDVIKTGICGSDLHYWVLGMPEGLVMGHEFCGKVVDPGSRSDLSVGDIVTGLPISPCGVCEACLSGNPQYCPHTWENAVGLSLTYTGGLAPTLAIRPDMVMKISDNMKPEEGAMVEPTAVGLHAIHLADIKVGDKVLVIGGGIIGLVSAMFAKLEGASSITVSETNPLRGEKSVSLGVSDYFVNPAIEGGMDKLKSIGGFDVVIECVGNAKAVNSAIDLVKPGGTIVLVGVSMLPIEVNSLSVVMKELTVLGAIGYTKGEFATCIDLMANKQIDVLKFVDDVVPLEGVQGAYERVTSGNDSAVKILVDPNL